MLLTINAARGRSKQASSKRLFQTRFSHWYSFNFKIPYPITIEFSVLNNGPSSCAENSLILFLWTEKVLGTEI